MEKRQKNADRGHAAAPLLIFAVSFWLLFRCKINPLYVMAGSGLLGLIFYSVWP